MSYNGSGTFSPFTPGNPVITGTTISSTAFNATIQDIAAGLTNAVTRDGQSPLTANLPAAGRKITGLGAGVVAGDSLRFEQLFSQGAEQDIASAATVDIGGLNTTIARITGTTTITSFGTNYNGPRYVRFAGALTLTHNATTLILPGGANITTAAGDRAILTPVGNPGSGWQVLVYQPAALFVGPTALAGRTALGFTAPVIDRAYAEYTTNADLSAVIPSDDTIPQNTEGTQILSVSLTPKSTTNRVRLRFQGEFALLTAGSAAFAVFSSASANALRSNLVAGGATNPTLAALEYEYVPGTTSALTFTVRVGPIAANTMRLNGNTSTRFFGGTMGATLIVEEIAA